MNDAVAALMKSFHKNLTPLQIGDQSLIALSLDWCGRGVIGPILPLLPVMCSTCKVEINKQIKTYILKETNKLKLIY